ncbi:MAG: hypothetical protein E7163_00590 [Firmicutes bacterium]|nr:hypothetical protein [Bacillota bacterium]
MRIVKNLKNFLLDQDYYIDIFDNNLHVYYYESLIHLSDKLIKLKLKEFSLEIEGKDLIVSSMDNHEILIKGIINNVRFIR